MGKVSGLMTRKDRVGATLKGQRRPERPTTAGGHRRHSGAGGFLKAAFTSHWRRMTIRDAMEWWKWQEGEKCDYKCLRGPGRPCDSGSAPTTFETGRLWSASFQKRRQKRRRETECIKRQAGVGGTPKGQRRPQRPTTAGGHRRHSGKGGFLKRLSRSIGCHNMKTAIECGKEK